MRKTKRANAQSTHRAYMNEAMGYGDFHSLFDVGTGVGTILKAGKELDALGVLCITRGKILSVGLHTGNYILKLFIKCGKYIIKTVGALGLPEKLFLNGGYQIGIKKVTQHK